MDTQETTANDFGFNADMASLYMNPLYSDVEFLVEGQRLPGHRLILATRSEYFRGLLSDVMAESTKQEVQLEGPLEAFKVIPKCLYTGELPLSSLDVDKMIKVRDLAYRYRLDHVKTAITEYLQQNLSVSNVCAILDAAKRYNLEQSIKECRMFMDRNAYDVLKHDSFQMLTKQSLVEFLQRDILYAPEVEIFKSVCKWMEKNPSEDIETVVSVVRFPLMSIDDLLNVVRPSGIIESEKFIDIIAQVNIGTNLPHRIATLPWEDVASEEHLAQRFTDNPTELVIQMRAPFLINCIYIWNSSGCRGSPLDSEFRVEVSCDRHHWDHVETVKRRFLCDIFTVRFNERPVRYIRIHRTGAGPRVSAMFNA